MGIRSPIPMKKVSYWTCTCTVHYFFTVISYYLIGPSSSSQLKRCTGLIQQLELLVQNTAVHPFLDHINSCLFNAVLSAKSATKTNQLENHPVLPQAASIPPGKNFEHQWRLKRTTNQSGTKKKGIILKLKTVLHYYNVSDNTEFHTGNQLMKKRRISFFK